MKFTTQVKRYFRTERVEILREIVLSVVISAVVSSIFTFYVDKKMDQRIADRQFFYDFGRTFTDNPKYRNISIAIEEQYWYGKEDRISAITEYDLDDYLGLLSDMWLYYQKGYVSQDLFANQYYYYLCVTTKSKLINDYRNRLTQQGFADDWAFLDEVTKEFDFANHDCKIY